MRVRGTFSAMVGLGLAALAVLSYLAWIFAAEPGETRQARWRSVGVHAVRPAFLDLYIFPSARALQERGDDIFQKSETDPYTRGYNYPRLWLTFMRFPADPEIIEKIGIAVTAAGLLSVLVLWYPAGWKAGLWGASLLCSPAVMLGVERANSDLLIITLIGAGLLLWRRKSFWANQTAQAVWVFATCLKVYPLAALVALGRRTWPDYLRQAGWCVLVCAGLAAAFPDDIAAIFRNTEFRWTVSYGATATALTIKKLVQYKMNAELSLPMLTVIARLASLAVMATAMAVGYRWNRRCAEPPATGMSAWAPASYRVGAAVYLLTFVAGNSFDYRKIFLLLLVPQLVAWLEGRDREFRNLAVGTAVTVTAAVWLHGLLFAWPGVYGKLAADWGLVALLALGLAATWRTTEVHQTAAAS